jgi:GT2 family glycosyltransferase
VSLHTGTSAPGVSVLIVEHGTDALTARAVAALRKSRYAGRLEVLAFRNAAAAESPIAGADRVLAVADNLGFGAATNELAARASGELLLLLNNDVVITPRCLAQLVGRLLAGGADDTSIAAVAAQLRLFDGSTLELGAYVDGVGRGWQLFRGEPIPESFLRWGYECAYGSAACLLVRRADYQAAGGFDPAFSPAYYEDTDLCHRLTRAGRRIVVEPTAVAYHLEGGTSESDSGHRHAMVVHGRTTFAFRWARELRQRAAASREAAVGAALWGLPERVATDGVWEGAPSPLRIVWLLPEPLLPDRTGGSARIHREVAVLAEAGCRQVVWSEQGGDAIRVGQALQPLGVRWGSFQRPVRWAHDAEPLSCLDTVESLLANAEPDVVILWSAALAAALLPRVRAITPRSRVVIDLGVLAYLQAERAQALAIDEPAIAMARDVELGAYASADAVIASSRLEARILAQALPAINVVAYDVGAYPPAWQARQTNPDREVVFLGNFLHPPNRDAVVWWLSSIAPELERLMGRVVPLRVVGNASEGVGELDRRGSRLVAAGWVEDLGSELSRAQVCVAPLRYGAGTKVKVAQAMGYGRTVVTTSVGAESMPDALQSALLVEDEAAGFARAVARLLTDRAYWEAQARRTRTAATVAWEAQRLQDRALVEALHAVVGRVAPSVATTASSGAEEVSGAPRASLLGRLGR